LGIGDEFVEHGKVAQLYDKIGISTAEMVSHISQWMKK